MTKVHIAVLMMLKNESARLHVSLESVKNFANSLVILDTGSTDNTIQICKDFSEKNNIILRLKESEFVNFAVSRNESLDFADSFEDINYILLLDCNDELRNGDILRKFAEDSINIPSTAFLITQEWFSGALDSYYNTRFIKSRQGWRYIGVVHEYMATNIEENKKDKDGKDIEIVRIPSTTSIYQDRTKDTDGKTGKRFTRDRELLLGEYKKDPTEPRNCFYLAQTYACLGDFENAYYYYKTRTSLIGFWEEVFQSMLKCGDLSEKLNHDWYDSLAWYMKAFTHTPRVEPLLKIAEYYAKTKFWIFAFTFCDLACKLNYPDHCILFVDKLSYVYKRYHLMGIIGFYSHNYVEGKAACLRAIDEGTKLKMNVELDKKNLQFYLDRENKNEIDQIHSDQIQPIQNNVTKQQSIVTKVQFMQSKITELKRDRPNATDKQLISMAKLLWKTKNK